MSFVTVFPQSNKYYMVVLEISQQISIYFILLLKSRSLNVNDHNNG